MKRLTTPVLAAALALLPIALPTPVAAQERVLTVFGNDKCPDNTICVRAPEQDRYRIPKELRGASTNPRNQSWAVRSQAAMSEGASGAGSCSSVGPGGWTGCWAEQMRRAKAERKAQAKESGSTP
jgi:hypothetical protein